MRLILLLGAAHGTVVEHEDTPRYFRTTKRERVYTMPLDDCGNKRQVFETITYEYVLFAHGPEEAYYIPRGFNNLQVVKGLLAAQ